MHFVQARIFRAAPFTTARTFWRLMFQRRELTLCAWLIRLPNAGPRPQISHTLAMTGKISSRKWNFNCNNGLGTPQQRAAAGRGRQSVARVPCGGGIRLLTRAARSGRRRTGLLTSGPGCVRIRSSPHS